MKKIIILIVLSVTVCSCKLTDQKDDNEEKKALMAGDSLDVNDKDEHGCLESAGYVWSKLNKECIKGFTGIQLNPIDKPDNEDETLGAYILFSEDTRQAEIFLPNENSSLILTRENNEKIWVYKDWQLIASNGYVLKNADKDMFSGDGQIGKKITSGDNE